MCKAICASVLVVLLSCSTYAGEMQNDVKRPLPPSTTAAQETTAGGIMQNEEPDGLTETVLSLLGSVLALF
jgi:hypothetical protein